MSGWSDVKRALGGCPRCGAPDWERQARQAEAEVERLRGVGQAMIDKVHAEHEKECLAIIDERDALRAKAEEYARTIPRYDAALEELNRVKAERDELESEVERLRGFVGREDCRDAAWSAVQRINATAYFAEREHIAGRLAEAMYAKGREDERSKALE